MTTEKLTTDEVNRYIAIEIMGLCWHEPTPDRSGPEGGHCKHCGDIVLWRSNNKLRYTSDSSPRSLLNEVVAKVKHTPVACERFCMAIDAATFIAVPRAATALSLTAEQIARAVVTAHQGANEK